MPVRAILADSSAAVADLFVKGQRLLGSRQIPEAIDFFDLASKLGYDSNECASARWQCWMLLGDFERAWQESDQIAACGADGPQRFWDGASWNKRRVMLRCLHGLGDTIQFIRYAPLLRETCGHLIVQTHPELVSLLEGVQGIDRVVTWGPGYREDYSEWDMQMEVTELPRAFRTAVSTIPKTSPYITIPQERLVWASQRLLESGRPRIGIVWKAGPWNPARSVPFTQLIPLLNESGGDFYSLHNSIEENIQDAYPMLRDIGRHSADVRDTAAFIAHMDLTITVDTMTAHLAGALRRPVWILLPAEADWRWMLQRDNSPWYPSARLFRQDQQGDWGPILNELPAHLHAYLAGLPDQTRKD